MSTASASWTLGYDANGNRTSVVLNGTTSTYTTPTTSNRLTSVTNPARSLGYDNAGNTTSDGYSATYNLAGRLATLLKAGVTTTYSVDGQGRRVRKLDSTGAASTVVFVYDQGGQLLGEYNSNGAAIREYVWLGNTPVAVFTPDPASATNPPLVYFIHTDHLNTPRVVVNPSGALRWSWIAEPFGTTAPNTNPAALGAFAFNLRFPGQYADSESGLFYNFFRDYDGSIGRYTQSDPIGLAGGINTYAYVGGNPVSRTDPYGLWAVTIDAFTGVGGGMTFGRDPNTGQGFMMLRAGWGAGGGFKWEKNGGRPGSEGATPASCKVGGVGAGVFADADFNLGPLQAGIQNSLGRNSGWSQPFGQFMSPSWSLGDSWGIKAGWSAGGQVTGWSPGP